MREWYAYGSRGLSKQATDHDESSWYHGSSATFGRFDLDHDRTHQYGPKHWNSLLGSHFTSEHHTAANLARENPVGTTPGAVYHVELSARNPKHYISEFDLDKEARNWAEDQGYEHYAPNRDTEGWLRHHPQVKSIAHGFREHLQSQGHDGVTYGNEYEGSHLHECAIAFSSDDIAITHRHTSEDDCDHDEKCPGCHHHYEAGTEGYCDYCGHSLPEVGDENQSHHGPWHTQHEGHHLGALTRHFGMASNSQEHNRAFGYDHPKPTYVRFGDWSADERSMNHITGYKEDGVSVYDLDKHGDPMDPDYDMDRGQHHEHCEPDCDMWDHDEDNTEFHDDTADMLRGHLEDCRRGHNTRPDRRAHLVQGDQVSSGHDDEPVLNHLKTVGHWPCDVHKFVPTAEPRSPSWCYHPDHDEDDEDDEDDEGTQHTAAKDEDPKETLKWLLKELAPRYNPPEKTDEQKAAEEADHQRRVKKHEDWQAKRRGYSPGDDLSDWEGYPHAEWVPIQVAQRFREHTGDQHQHSERNVDRIHQELKAGRGMTDPLMLLHHSEANRASLGEGNHRLRAAERAGWTHIPMRVVRMYDGEAERGKGETIPRSWRGSHSGRTPEMCRPSDVLSEQVMGTPPPQPDPDSLPRTRARLRRAAG